jgi:hypothetical protein
MCPPKYTQAHSPSQNAIENISLNCIAAVRQTYLSGVREWYREELKLAGKRRPVG